MCLQQGNDALSWSGKFNEGISPEEFNTRRHIANLIIEAIVRAGGTNIKKPEVLFPEEQTESRPAESQEEEETLSQPFHHLIPKNCSFPAGNCSTLASSSTVGLECAPILPERCSCCSIGMFSR
jgi:hypothetical protein